LAFSRTFFNIFVKATSQCFMLHFFKFNTNSTLSFISLKFYGVSISFLLRSWNLFKTDFVSYINKITLSNKLVYMSGQDLQERFSMSIVDSTNVISFISQYLLLTSIQHWKKN
jgi:hypothetical protein